MLPTVSDLCWDAAIKTAVDEFGKLNGLVNNAGIVNGAQLEKFRIDKFRQILDVNLTGSFIGMVKAVDPMKAAGGGSIINVSSVEGLQGSPWAHGYVASKWAVRGLAKSAALELGPHNIRVNSIHPGLIRTPMTENIPDDMLKIPLGRAAQPDEVSTFVVFLIRCRCPAVQPQPRMRRDVAQHRPLRPVDHEAGGEDQHVEFDRPA